MSGTRTLAHGRITGRTSARIAARSRRHLRVRKRITGSAVRPRLVVTRSSRHLFAQLVDDSVGGTLVSASTLEAPVRGSDGDKTAKAKQVGALLAEREPIYARADLTVQSREIPHDAVVGEIIGALTAFLATPALQEDDR